MQSRDDNPYLLFNFNFAVDSVFNDVREENSGDVPSNEFLLLDGETFLLLDNTDFLLLGT